MVPALSASLMREVTLMAAGLAALLPSSISAFNKENIWKQISSVAYPDPHHFGNLDPHPDPHHFGNLDPHPHQNL
jgi:hypothetical protein